VKKKTILVIAAVVLLLVVLDRLRLCQPASDPEEIDAWQLLCQDAFQRLQSEKPLHYTYVEDSHHSRIGKNLRTVYDCWVSGEDFYSHFDGSSLDVRKVRVGQAGYEDHAGDGWKSSAAVSPVILWRNTEWSEFLQNKKMTVAYVKDGTEVSFFEDLGYQNCTLSRQTIEYVFCFDENKNLTCVKESFITYNGTEIVPGDVYCSDSSVHYFRFIEEAAVNQMIQSAFFEASK